MNVLFPNYFYFKYKAPNFDEFINELELETNINNDDFSWGKECKVDKILLNSKKHLNYLIPSLQLLCNDLEGQIELDIVSSWMNFYKKGYHQEIHMHRPNDLVCVFFMNSGDDFSKFYFYDRNNVDIPFVWDKIVNLRSKHFVEYERGDIIFFPAHMLHGVSVHNSDIVRKTFSCNININLIT